MAPYLGNTSLSTTPTTEGEIPDPTSIALQSSKPSNEVSGLVSTLKIKEGLKTHTATTTDSSSRYAIPMNPDFAYKPRKLRVITIGAGFSGLIIAHKFQHRFPELQEIIDHKIFEARKDIGGTWLVNTYPGVQCDVPAHLYVS